MMCRPDATTHIDLVRYQFEVVRIDASRSAAKMIPLKPPRRTPDQEVVSLHILPFKAKHAVALVVEGGQPDHVAVSATRIDLGPKALLGRAADAFNQALGGIAGFLPASVVEPAPPGEILRRTVAGGDGTVSLHWKALLSGAMRPDVEAVAASLVYCKAAF